MDSHGTPPEAACGSAALALAALQQRFRQGLVERWNAIVQADTDAGMAAHLHRLAGAAGSYGLPQLGQAAHHAELAARHGGGPVLQAALEQLFEALGAAVASEERARLLPPSRPET